MRLTFVKWLLVLVSCTFPLGALANVGVNKSFNPISASTGQVSTLRIDLINANAAAATGTSLTDTLPSGLVIATPPNASTTCGGTVSATAGVGSVSLVGGTIPAASGGPGSCFIVVSVVSAAPASYVNTIPVSAVVSSQGTNTQSASATLTIVALSPVAASKAFAPVNVHGNGASTLTITLPNSNGVDLTGVSLNDVLPPQLVIAAPANLGTTCSPGTASGAAGGNTLGLSGATIPANGSCTVSVDVTPSTPNTFSNGNATNSVAANKLTSDQGVTNAAFSKTILVQTSAQVTKAFNPNPITSSGTSSLKITINNYNNSTVSPVNLTDSLPAGMTATAVPTTTCGGSTAASTATQVVLTGGSLPAAPAASGSSNCTISVPVTAVNGGSSPVTLTNAIPAGNFAGENYNAASGTLTVDPPSNISGSKSFSATARVQTGVVTLTVTLNNVTATPATITGVTDNLATMGAGYTVAASPPASSTCGGPVTAPPGGTTITMASGTIPANGSCTITVPVQVGPSAATGNRTNTIAAGAVQTSQGNNALPIAATVPIVAALKVGKTFSPSTVFAGSTTHLTITLTRAADASALSNLTLSDALPAGHLIATPANASTTCGGTLSAASGSTTLGFSGGSLGGGAGATSCVIQADVVTPSGAGSATNTIAAGNVTTTELVTNAAAASATVTRTTNFVSLSKGFSPSTTAVNGTSTMSVQILNSNPGAVALTNGSLTDNLPAGMLVATPANATFTGGGCSGATITAVPGASVVSLSGAAIAANSVCLLKVDVVAKAAGNLINQIPANGFTSAQGTSNVSPVSATLTSTGLADLGVTKTDGVTTAVPGSSVTYVVTYTNSGPNDAAGATIADNPPAGVTFTAWTCAPSAGASCPALTGSGPLSGLVTIPVGGTVTFSVTAQIASGATGSITNTTTITAPGSVVDPVLGNNSATDTDTLAPQADISVVKTGPPTVASGGPISYSLLVSNAGASDANAAAYSDFVPAGITGVSAACSTTSGAAVCAAPTVSGNTVSGVVSTFPANSSVTITITGVAPFGAQMLNNTATVSSPPGVPDPNPGNNSSAVSTTIGGAADIAVTKTVDNPAPFVGQQVTYTITAKNNGPDNATGVALTDSLPSGLGFISAVPSQGSYTSATGLWTIGNLANGASVTLTIVASVDQPGSLTNTVAVSASDQPDPNTSNNNAGAPVNAGASADIAVGKTVDNAVPNVGSTVTYTLTATNNGPDNATGVEITDNLPTGTSFVSAAPPGVYNAGSGVWTVGALANGTATTLTITARVDAAGSITNNATVTREDQFDPVSANNQAGVTINGQQADLAVTKTVDNANPDVGSNVTFSVTVHNNGPSDATGVVLTDLLPPGLAFVSSIPSQGSYDGVTGLWTVGTLTAAGSTSTATLSVIAKVTAAGALANTASVTAADQPDPNAANNSASAALNGNPQADLALVKTGAAMVTPGNNLVYTIVVTNNGPSDAINVVVADTTPSGLTFVSNAGACASAYPCTLSTLANDASATITTTYDVPADYAGVSPIVNTASVSSDTPDPDMTNNQGSAHTSVGPGNADLAIVKTGPATLASGAAISYTLTITNNGPSPANAASYSDAVPVAITGVTATCGGETGGAACASQPSVTGNTVAGSIGALPSGGSAVITINGIAPPGPATLNNSATIAAPTGVNDPVPGNNSSSFSTTIGAPSADLSIVKTGPASVTAGGAIVYAIVVTNNGPDAAANVVVSDTTPSGLTFVTNTGACATAYPCAIGALANGASMTITSTYAMPSSYAGPNPVVNTATVVSDTPDPNGANNSGAAMTPVIIPVASADLSVTKTGPASATAGSSVAYTLVVTNHGPNAVPDAVLADATPPGLIFVSASAPCAGGFPCALGVLANGASVSLTVTYAVNASFAGSIANVAQVNSATVPDPVPGNNSGSATTTVRGGNPAPPAVPIPVGARWMLASMSLLLMLLAWALLARRGS